jgi:hypothetical protein
MFVPFEALPESARIWLYQADRKLTREEQDTISSKLLSFTNQWVAHNQPLRSSFLILHDQFVVLAVDESYSGASGCSIDSSVHVIRSLVDEMQVDFFNRANVAFWIDEEVKTLSLSGLAEKLEEGFWNANTIVFDNTILTIGALKSKWMVQARNSWLRRYLAKTSV